MKLGSPESKFYPEDGLNSTIIRVILQKEKCTTSHLTFCIL